MVQNRKGAEVADEYISVQDAAKRLERSVPTIWRVIKKYGLQTFRRPMDRKAYLLLADLERLQAAFQPRRRVQP